MSVPIDETIDLSASNTLDATGQFEIVAPTSDVEQEPAEASNASLLGPESEEDSELAEDVDVEEIMSPEELDRLPLHEGGERDAEDSDDVQSAEPESYEDDEATTDEEPVDENAPYNEPEEFVELDDEQSDEVEPPAVQQNQNRTIELDDEQSEASAEEFAEDYGEDEEEIEDPEFAQYSDSEGGDSQQAPEGDDDSGSDIIVLD